MFFRAQFAGVHMAGRRAMIEQRKVGYACSVLFIVYLILLYAYEFIVIDNTGSGFGECGVGIACSGNGEFYFFIACYSESFWF